MAVQRRIQLTVEHLGHFFGAGIPADVAGKLFGRGTKKISIGSWHAVAGVLTGEDKMPHTVVRWVNSGGRTAVFSLQLQRRARVRGSRFFLYCLRWNAITCDVRWAAFLLELGRYKAVLINDILRK